MCTGPQWKQSGPDRDSPLGYLIASGMFEGSYEAVPVAPYLGVRGRLLKSIGKRFEPIGKVDASFDQRRVGPGRDNVVAPVDDLVGKQQRGEQ